MKGCWSCFARVCCGGERSHPEPPENTYDCLCDQQVPVLYVGSGMPDIAFIRRGVKTSRHHASRAFDPSMLECSCGIIRTHADVCYCGTLTRPCWQRQLPSYTIQLPQVFTSNMEAFAIEAVNFPSCQLFPRPLVYLLINPSHRAPCSSGAIADLERDRTNSIISCSNMEAFVIEALSLPS